MGRGCLCGCPRRVRSRLKTGRVIMLSLKEVASNARSAELVAQLAAVWERSVRATHGFLAEEDIVGMRPDVPNYIRGIAQLTVAHEDDRAIGFAGVEDGSLEMLFIDAEARGRGTGKALLRHAVENQGVVRLDVNEQNPQARGFYEHEGFRVVSRSELDGEGRPFPLLHMELAGEVVVREV